MATGSRVTDNDDLQCSVCGKPIRPRSIRPGAARCPQCREIRGALAALTYYGPERDRQVPPDERLKLRAAKDAVVDASFARTPVVIRVGTPSRQYASREFRTLAFGAHVKGRRVGPERLLRTSGRETSGRLPPLPPYVTPRERARREAALRDERAERQAAWEQRPRPAGCQERTWNAYRLRVVERLSIGAVGRQLGITKSRAQELIEEAKRWETKAAR